MNDLIFHHIGIACESIEESIADYEQLGYFVVGKQFEDPNQGIRGVFMENAGVQIELLEPLDEKSPLHSFLNRGVQMYHQGFFCDDILDTSLDMVEKGAMIVSPAKPAVAFNGRSVCFLMMPNKMLIELIGTE